MATRLRLRTLRVKGTDVAAVDGAELTEGDGPNHVAVVIVADQNLVAYQDRERHLHLRQRCQLQAGAQERCHEQLGPGPPYGCRERNSRKEMAQITLPLLS